MKLTWLIWWPAHLVPTARWISTARFVVSCTAAHERAEVELGRGEQAGAELAVGGEADAVAIAAERLA